MSNSRVVFVILFVLSNFCVAATELNEYEGDINFKNEENNFDSDSIDNYEGSDCVKKHIVIVLLGALVVVCGIIFLSKKSCTSSNNVQLSYSEDMNRNLEKIKDYQKAPREKSRIDQYNRKHEGSYANTEEITGLIGGKKGGILVNRGVNNVKLNKGEFTNQDKKKIKEHQKTTVRYYVYKPQNGKSRIEEYNFKHKSMYRDVEGFLDLISGKEGYDEITKFTKQIKVIADAHKWGIFGFYLELKINENPFYIEISGYKNGNGNINNNILLNHKYSGSVFDKYLKNVKNATSFPTSSGKILIIPQDKSICVYNFSKAPTTKIVKFWELFYARFTELRKAIVGVHMNSGSQNNQTVPHLHVRFITSSEWKSAWDKEKKNHGIDNRCCYNNKKIICKKCVERREACFKAALKATGLSGKIPIQKSI